MKKYTIFLFISFIINILVAQERQPVVKLSSSIPRIWAFTNVNIVISPEKTIENATLVIKNGLIEEVGEKVVIPKEASVRDLRGYWIYPGFIDAASDYGLNAPKRGGADDWSTRYEGKNGGTYHWNDAVKAHVSALDSFKVSASSAENLRGMGFTLANVVPNDGIFRGQGMLVHLGDGKLKEDLFITESCAAFSFSKGSSGQSYPTSLVGAVALIRQTMLDAEQYKQSLAIYSQNPIQAPIKPNLSLAAFLVQKEQKYPLIFQTESWQHTLQAAEIAQEFGLKFVFRTNGDEYKRIAEMQKLGTSFIIPLKFPKAYEVKSVTDSREIALEKLKEWEQAPMNPALLVKNKIPFVITASGTPASEFNANILKSISYGLSENELLTALTTSPAKLLGIEKEVGTLEKGKFANFIISNGKMFNAETKIQEVYVSGKKYVVNAIPEVDMRADYKFSLNKKEYLLKIEGENTSPSAKVVLEKDTLKADFSLQNKNRFNLAFQTKDSIKYRVSGILFAKNPANLDDLVTEKTFEGVGEDSKGNRFTFLANKSADFVPAKKKPSDAPKKVNLAEISPVTFPNKAFGFLEIPKQEVILFKNATVWTNTKKGIAQNTDVLVENGKITNIGDNQKAPVGARVVDATGKHLTNGIIDEHSHIALMQGVNEASHSVTAEVRMGDAIDAEDIDIYRQLAGGVTTSQLLHGSINPIGGQSQVIKLRWGASPDEMKFEKSKPFIKFALGENVKQSNSGDNNRTRYPQTRMGVEQMMQDAFRSAKDYRTVWEEWEKNGKNAKLAPPRKDLQLETLLEILDGKRFITCHSYVQSEITMLMRLAEKEGFKINTFTHILEGYKVADKMKAHGVSASSFADWWGYKYEVFEAIPQNATILHNVGVNVCINSDDVEMARRLNQEAAKSVKYGGMSEEDAWKMVTLNPAKALHIDDYVGTIEKGKDADLVLWSDNPLSIYAKPLYTLIDGRCYFDFEKDAEIGAKIKVEKQRILQKMMSESGSKQDAAAGKKEKNHYHCDTLEDYK
jgi:imidazolonepropionase-like amidohydrolase